MIVALAQADPRRRIILASGPSDARRRHGASPTPPARRLSTPESLPPLVDLDLGELRALVARAAVYIGGDSGPLHMAATTRTPIVALLGPTLPERSRRGGIRAASPRSWTPARCRAGRVISGAAYPATSGA